jgi:Arc/MetJ-type ribon-helix-helix transcriptional regulator
MSKTAKTTKIAISLPEEVLDAVERERGESGESRSEFFRRAVEALLRRQREQELSEQLRSLGSEKRRNMVGRAGEDSREAAGRTPIAK